MSSQAKKTDVVFVHSPEPSGDGFRVVRARDDKVELGELRTLRDGQEIRGELVKLKPRKEHKQLFDVQPLPVEEVSTGGASHPGPARVASESYREHWDEIFRAKKPLLN